MESFFFSAVDNFYFVLKHLVLGCDKKIGRDKKRKAGPKIK